MESELVRLQPTTRWIGRRLDVYAEVESTNVVCEALGDAGAPEGTLVVADGQSAGRGRLGRSFFSPPGTGLYLSLLLRPPERPDHVHGYIFAAALAVADSARAALPERVAVEIKWPNDVRLDGRKTSGINLPVRLERDRVAFCVLGVGVNVNLEAHQLPPDLAPIATSLRIAGGVGLDRVDFCLRLLERLEAAIESLRERGLGAILERWRNYFTMGGQRVGVGGPGVAREITGLCEGVDAEGALMVRTAHGQERVLAGDVTLLGRES